MNSVAFLLLAAVLVNGRNLESKLSYAPGEKMTFVISAEGLEGDGFRFVGDRCGDDGKRVRIDEPIADGKPVTFVTSMDRPGFVRISGAVKDRDGKGVSGKRTRFDGGAAVEIGKLEGAYEPPDFDAFWARQKARLAKVPVKAELKEIACLKPEIASVYEVRIDCAGPRPVTGYLMMPKNRKRKYPIRVGFDGYGVYSPQPFGYAIDSTIVFGVNAHGMDLGKDEAYAKEFEKSVMSNGKGYGLDPVENADPEKAYFNGMALRVMRALEWVKTLPEWNGRAITVSGPSQGGLQSVWAASLDHQVTRAEPSIVWSCDLLGPTAGRLSPNWGVGPLKSMAYYDPVNHAKRIPETCEVRIPRAGLGDYTSPPSGIACLYNALKGPKRISWYQGSTHSYIPRDKDAQVYELKTSEGAMK